MIVGSTSGSMIKPMIGRWPGKRNRAAARAAQMPSAVESTAAATPTCRLFQTVVCSGAAIQSCSKRRW